MPHPTNLRDRLRSDTRGAHDRLDRMIERLDVTTPTGLLIFLQGQYAAGAALLQDVPIPPAGVTSGTPAIGMTPGLAALLKDLNARLEADLARLGSPLPGAQRLDGPVPARDALRYVCLGARAGTVVLARRHGTAQDSRVRAAREYFEAPRCAQDWRNLCAELVACPADAPHADRIIADAERLFMLFETCFKAAEMSVCTSPGEAGRQSDRTAPATMASGTA